MNEIKRGLYLLLQGLLWISFLMGLNDPGLLGTRPAGSFAQTYAFLLDPLYQFCDIMTSPVQWVTHIFYNPEVANSMFPVMSFADFAKNVFPSFGIQNTSWAANFLPGAMIWWIPITSIMLSMLSVAFDHFYPSFRNSIWNVIIEYVFHRKKVRAYAKALDERNADLARLNSRYSTLAEETHTLKDSVITDELTKIYNKRFFLNRIQMEFDVCKGQRSLLSVIMIDIDFFKRLNDSYGHLSGDEVLKAVASEIKKSTPEMCYPCRYGGEEFSIIMPNKSSKEASEVAHYLQDNIQQLKFDGIDKKLKVSISQGICTVDFADPEAQQVKKFDEVLELADRQLYRSKMEGRNRVSVQVLSKQT